MFDTEIWKDIAGYEGCYSVSNHGRVRSIERYVKSNRGGKQLVKAKILKNKGSSGYLDVGLSKDGKAKTHTVHTLVATAFLERLPHQNRVNHKDGNKGNNHVSNLEWCTQAENIDHAWRTGLSTNAGEKHYQKILTWEKVRIIRKKYIPFTYSVTRLALEFKVSRSTIQDILQNKIWKEK